MRPGGGSGPRRWSIDPIDGTGNLVHGLPLWAISIGLIENGQPVLGVIAIPPLAELYWAVKGQGAWLDGKQLQARDAESIHAGVPGTPYLTLDAGLWPGWFPTMARLARVIAPGMPHHVTQRGNRRQQTFFGKEDYQHYLELISRFCRAEQVAIWAYRLMPNHVHLIVVPQSAESLRRAIGEAHRRYTRRINFREGWRGHLWQGRFASFVMDEDHLLTAARYVELNPVRAGLVQAPSR